MTLEDYFWLPILEKLRQEQRQDIQRPQLQLPLPVPPYNEEPPHQDPPEDVYDRGVVIIDMFGDDEN